MPQTFFTSDLHFSHTGIAKLCPQFRPFGDTGKADEHIVRLWNETVSPADTVYNLGDLTFSRDLAAATRLLGRLNGQHHLIFGNHDGLIEKHLNHFLNTPKHDGHPLLSSAQHILKIKLPGKGQTAVLFHYPVWEWEGCRHGWYHLYGHLHDRLADMPGRALNVGYDLHGRFLTPADIEAFLEPLAKTNRFGSKEKMPDTPEAAREYVRRSLEKRNS